MAPATLAAELLERVAGRPRRAPGPASSSGASPLAGAGPSRRPRPSASTPAMTAASAARTLGVAFAAVVLVLTRRAGQHEGRHGRLRSAATLARPFGSVAPPWSAAPPCYEPRTLRPMAADMQAWVVDRPVTVDAGPLRRVERPVPEPGPRQVRMRVSVCGVCRTDLHSGRGRCSTTTPSGDAGTRSGRRRRCSRPRTAPLGAR